MFASLKNINWVTYISGTLGYILARYCGFNFIIPFVYFLFSFFILNKFYPSYKNIKKTSVSILMAHVAWMTTGIIFVPAMLLQVSLDLIIMSYGIYNLSKNMPNKLVNISLITLQVLAIIGHFNALINDNTDPRSMTIHILLRLIFIISTLILMLKSKENIIKTINEKDNQISTNISNKSI
jgi:magnesium-transporting ATPase (P-type)